MEITEKSLNFITNTQNVPKSNILNILKLHVGEECTVPFIVRYRKEMIGGLDEEVVRNIIDLYNEHLEIEKRREFILTTLKSKDQLTKELEGQILKAENLNQLEDIYAPFKQKKKSKGTIAKEQGLEPLASILLETKNSLKEIEAKYARDFIDKEKGIETFEAALEGASHIIIEKMAHDPELKDELRLLYKKEAYVVSKNREKEKDHKEYLKFKDYFDYKEKLSSLFSEKGGHRFLALKRGASLKILKVDVEIEAEWATSLIKKKYVLSGLGAFEFLANCADKAQSLYIHPSLDLEFKSELKKTSDETAISVFGVNLKNLLLQPYLGPKAVLGIDPGVVTGCKVAVVSDTGALLFDTVIYPHPPKNDKITSKTVIDKLIEHFKIEHVAIGNGTYGRETLQFFEENVSAVKARKCHATMISEAGASVYSASPIAKKEFPDKDPTVRGAVSIARRFQDPLAELVKIDPKSIGVGQYQHDVNQTRLKKSLSDVVESCVNYVGVDLNTASAPLLSYISGIGPSVADNIVAHREKKGAFKKRDELLKVTRFSAKTFEQAAGFLRIYNGENPLDATFIHPERYPLLEGWAKKHNISLLDLSKRESVQLLERDTNLKDEIGPFTFDDIVKSLKAPVQDPRDEFKSIEFSRELKAFNDVQVGSWYTGVVNNITHFGAFVDIGIKESGLIHVSQISDTYVESALDKLKVGQAVKVKVLELDHERRRISLSMKSDSSPTHSPQTSRNEAKHSSQAPKYRKEGKELANNPFASLKNFKVK